MVITPQQRKAAVNIILAVTETIREARKVPSGTVYAAILDKITLQDYQAILAMLTRAGLIHVGSDHLISWTGKEFVA